MKRYRVWIILVLLWLATAGFAPSAVQVYSKAVEFARAGKEHFAFMYYNELLRNHPASKYREQALFATGEYYFQVSDFEGATTAFQAFLLEYPEAKERLYVLAYLLSIAQRNNNILSIEGLEKKIIDLQQVSFVFRETKEIAYRSPLYQNYKTVIHIDRIEFYLEGKLFAEVSY
jgi:outer membrane protein assembly factor BamD (BamD/ComL family)